MQHFVTKPTPEWLNDPGYLNLQAPLDSRISVALGVTSITPSQNLTRIGGSIAGTNVPSAFVGGSVIRESIAYRCLEIMQERA